MSLYIHIDTVDDIRWHDVSCRGFSFGMKVQVNQAVLFLGLCAHKHANPTHTTHCKLYTYGN